MSQAPAATVARRFFERLFPGELQHRVAFDQEVAARLPGTGRVLDLGCGRNLELAGSRRLARACAGTSLEVERIVRFADQGYFGFSNAARAVATACDWSFERVAAGWGRIYLTVVCRKNASGSVEPALR